MMLRLALGAEIFLAQSKPNQTNYGKMALVLHPYFHYHYGYLPTCPQLLA
jgi:hypothetical protein